MERERERKDGGCRVCGSRAREGRVHERAVQSGVILWIRTTLLWRTEVEISFAHTQTLLPSQNRRRLTSGQCCLFCVCIQLTTVEKGCGS